MDRIVYDPLPVNAPKASEVEEANQLRPLTEEGTVHLQQESRYLVYLRYSWRWEILTFLLGTGAFASILALLLKFRDTKPPALPLGNVNIQLTAVIAALAQVAQSALLVPIASCIGQLKWKWFQQSKQVMDLDRFDQASRGPDGSVRLLYHLSRRQRLVSLGALATILMLLFPTFVQQSVQISNKGITEYHNVGAAIARSINVFNDPQKMVKLSKLTGNGTILSYGINTELNTALWSGTTGYRTSNLNAEGSYSNIQGICGFGLSKCSWPPFNTLALCVSTTNISDQIVQDEKYVTLPALRNFLPNDEDPPSFQSGYHVYVPEGKLAAPSMRATSVSNGTNLASLAEIYYLFYDVCVDKQSGFNKSNLRPWRALEGRFQFCIQNQTASTDEIQSTVSILHSSTTSLEWYRTNKNNESAFCTRVDSEKEDFCVGESLMESLSLQIGSVFNNSAEFFDLNRTNINYSTDWGPMLAPAVYKATCSAEQRKRSWGGHFVDNSTVEGDFSAIFGGALGSIARSLSDTFRLDLHSDRVLGTITSQHRFLLVDFRWFILPAMVYGITAIFFTTTILITRDTPMWKSSSLPLLHAMENEGSAGCAIGIKEEAKTSQMKLRRAAKGWRLVERVEEKKEEIM